MILYFLLYPVLLFFRHLNSEGSEVIRCFRYSRSDSCCCGNNEYLLVLVKVIRETKDIFALQMLGSSRVHLEFISTSFGLHLDFISTSSRLHLDFIQTSSRLHSDFILTSSRLHLEFI